MTRHIVHTSRAPRSASTSSTRLRLAGGLVAGIAVTAAAVVVLSPGSEQTAPSLSSQSQAQPSVLAALPTALPSARPARRASRGGLRTALPPTRYVTRTVAAGPTFSGEASWYGGSFQGRRTASGERFNTYDLTAASKTLPFGTRLRVCRGSECVVVRVNDRGPYVGGRILDLSQAARTALGYDGVAYVTATPVETKRVALRPRPRPVPVVRRAALTRLPALAEAPSPAALPAPAPVLAAQEHPVNAPSVVFAAALLTLAGGGVLGARRRRTRCRS